MVCDQWSRLKPRGSAGIGLFFSMRDITGAREK
jgi:hypothetical protein